MIEWKRPSGTFIETNDSDASIQHAIDNDWKQVKAKPKTQEKVVDNDNGIADSRRRGGKSKH